MKKDSFEIVATDKAGFSYVKYILASVYRDALCVALDILRESDLWKEIDIFRMWEGERHHVGYIQRYDEVFTEE